MEVRKESIMKAALIWIIALLLVVIYFGNTKVNDSMVRISELTNKKDSLYREIDRYDKKVKELMPIFEEKKKLIPVIPEKTKAATVDSSEFNKVITIANKQKDVIALADTVIRTQMAEIESLKAVILTTDTIHSIRIKQLTSEVKRFKKNRWKKAVTWFGIGVATSATIMALNN